MRAKIFVTPKKGILDPQGQATQQALSALGHSGIEDVRIGKYLEIVLAGRTREEAEEAVRTMCQKLLANPIIEDYRFELE